MQEPAVVCFNMNGVLNSSDTLIKNINCFLIGMVLLFFESSTVDKTIMQSRTVAIQKVRGHLQIYLPTVLTTIITDYCCPGYNLMSINKWQPLNNSLTVMPPIDAIWQTNKDKINFFCSNGTAIGSLPLPDGAELLNVVITTTHIYLIHFSHAELNNNIWIVMTVGIKDGKMECIKTDTVYCQKRFSAFRSDTSYLAVITYGCYHFYNSRGYKLEEQHIDPGLKIIDLVRLKNRCIVLGFHKHGTVINIYQMIGGLFPLLHSFRLKGLPLLITADESKIII